MSKPSQNSQKLMDLVVPAASGDQLIGILSTTFELQPDFVETDLLPGVFALGAWDDRSWASRIAIERKLSEIESAVLFQAAEQYRGRPRSLRIEVVPVPRHGNRVLHAKVTVFVNENSIRVLVTSANLTEQGYRKNREVGVSLFVSPAKLAHTPLIRSCLEPMPAALSRWWTDGASRLVDRALAQLDEWSPSPHGADQDEAFVWSGQSEPLWQTFVRQWPEGEVVRSVKIVSPFWSQATANGPVELLLNALRERGGIAIGAAVELFTEARREPSGAWLPVLPDGYGAFDMRQLGVQAIALAVDPKPSRDEIDVADDRPRPLHAKIVLIEGARTSLAYVGSANFSRHGWGFLRDPGTANIEAGVILRRAGKHRDALASLIPNVVGRAVPLDGSAIGKTASPEPIVEGNPWPLFVRAVRLVQSKDSAGRLDAEIDLDEAAIGGEWSIWIPGEDDQSSSPLLTGRNPDASGDLAGEKPRVPLEPDALSRLLIVQRVLVKWWGAPEPTDFPINVDDVAKEMLPIAPGADRPGENLLLQYYQSKIAFEELFPPPPGSPEESETSTSVDAIESGVDTSRIQSYQIREFVEALRGIRDDLRRAAGARASMRQALFGPVSPLALAALIERAVGEQRRTTTAAAFQLVEIAACLSEARRFDTSEANRQQWLELLDEATSQVNVILAKLRQADPSLTSPSFQKYEKSIRSLSAGGVA